MYILGIESSCDDTSVALVDCSDEGFFVVAEKTASQIEIHAKYGGVVPEIAGRNHAEQIMPVIESVLDEAKAIINDNPRSQISNFKFPDVIAVTAGPGLMTGLLVGTEASKTLSYLWNIPMVAVNHIEGHVHSVFVNEAKNKEQETSIPLLDKERPTRSAGEVQFPAVCLIVSGGHTELVLMEDFGKYSLIGKTRDDAAGEAFDKVGKLLGLNYPGGPKISKLAMNGDPTAIDFPRPMLESDNFDFSFSGLKTAALYWLRDSHNTYHITRSNTNSRHKEIDKCYVLCDTCLKDFCASFEQAIIDVLVEKTKRAIKTYNAKTLILGGGVSANPKLKQSLEQLVNQSLISDFKGTLMPVGCKFPISNYSMDNGAMIAVAGYHHAVKKEYTKWNELEVNPNWHIYDTHDSK